ncbi:MAG: SPOR domain-containing protein [Candidatus Omnitrophica bacterium]|nr:SPOR domain-containing protein [Candidatus Omnitrophota bacterium]
MIRKTSLVIFVIFCLIGFFEGSLFADAFRDIEALILKDSYNQAAKECIDIISGKYNSSIKAKAHYLLGLCLLKQGKYEQARKQFSNVVNRYFRSQYYDDASLGIADSYFISGECAQASNLYKEFLRDFPRSELTSIARTHLKQCAQGPTFNNSCFSIQVGCFSNKENADKLLSELSNQGYEAYILKLSNDDLHRVRVGRFSTRLEAEFLEQRLKAEGYATKVCP